MVGTRGCVLALLLICAASVQAADERARAALLLSRATYGARPGDVERVLELGVDRWLDAQLHPERIRDDLVENKLEGFTYLDASIADLMEAFPRPSSDRKPSETKPPDSTEAENARDRRAGTGPARVLVEMSQAKLLRAIYSERQLQEVLTDFWFNHFNVYARKNRNTLLTVPSYERDAIRPNVLGTFEDLLLATASHPAMLFYLDNWVNAKEGFDPRAIAGRRRRAGTERRFGINENYARELLELHTLGVDSGYTQDDVVAVARALTGWSVVGPRLSELRERMVSGSRRGRLPRLLAGLPETGSFYFNPLAHDEEPKIVLGRRFETGGMEDGRQVLHMLATHPATARFVSTKLAERFVSDSPSEVLVDEMTDTFLDTGGDIRAVVSVMFRSDRFLEEGLGANKFKTPLELIVSSIRATSAGVRGPGLVRSLFDLGMPSYLCQPPTGYEEASSAWMTAGNVLTRIRFAEDLASGRIRGISPLTPPGDLEDWIASVLAPGEDVTAMAATAAVGGARGSMALVLASPGFQRQ